MVIVCCCCFQNQSTDRNEKLEDITGAVLDQLTGSCTDCTSDIIDMQSFACYPESPTYVTYRARLGGTSETDSGSLISLIEDWVSGGTSVIVTGVLMTVDTECPVTLSSLSEGECHTPTDPTTRTNMTTAESTTSSSQSSIASTTAVIAGVVAVIIAIVFAVATVAIVGLILKHRHGIGKAEE